MNIALIGYGKMGKAIEQIAIDRGHTIFKIFDVNNANELTAENLKGADAVIEFTVPESAYDNYMKCFEANVPVVSGTTGWLDRFGDVEKLCANDGASFFYASNFSLGVNLFFKLNKMLAGIMNKFDEYEVGMVEHHHTQKLDAPSGTAITLAEGVVENLDRKNGWELANTNEDKVRIDAIRRNGIPGTHTIYYESDIDFIEITHNAKTRFGFAFGAVLAAEFMNGKTSGVYGMDDMLKL